MRSSPVVSFGIIVYRSVYAFINILTKNTHFQHDYEKLIEPLFCCRGGNNGGPRISGGALHVPVGSGGNSLFVGRPPTSGGFGYGAGANFRHGGAGNTWVGGSPQNGGTLGVGGSFGLGRGGGGGGGSTIQWGAGYSPSDQSFRARVAVQFRKRR